MALSADRNTRAKHTFRRRKMEVAASTTIYAGALVCVNTSGYLVPASDTLGYVVVGVALEAAANSAGANGALEVLVETGVYALTNSSTNPVAQADVGRACYVQDDYQVADENGGGKVIAGTVDSIDEDTAEIWIMVPADANAEAAEGSPIETVSAAGAISVYTRTTLLSITGTAAFTLAAGRYEGQRKTIVCSAAASTPIGTITPATYASGTNEVMTAVGQTLELEYHDTGGWVKIADKEIEANAHETVTTGAISVQKRLSLISVTGTIAYTLADGLYEGQRKTIVCSAAASTPVGTITPATYASGTSERIMAVGEWYELEWHAGGWVKISSRETLGAPETVTTGALSLYTRVSLISCTGTIAYTLANGLYIGQRKTVIVSVAASTPVGTLTPATYADGTSERLMAVGERIELEWVGALGWKKIDYVLGQGAAETVTSGALSLYTEVSYISVTGTVAYTLADGLFIGQKKYCRCTVAASTPDGTLTPASPSGFATADFDAIEEAYGFRWNGTGWEPLYVIGGALSS